MGDKKEFWLVKESSLLLSDEDKEMLKRNDQYYIPFTPTLIKREIGRKHK